MLDLLGVSPQNKMFIRLYAPTSFLMISSVLVIVIEPLIYERMSSILMFSALSELIQTGGLWLSIILFTLSIMTFLYSTYRLWKWDKGEKKEFCHRCSGIVSERHGRYGFYYRCLACGSTQSDNR